MTDGEADASTMPVGRCWSQGNSSRDTLDPFFSLLMF